MLSRYHQLVVAMVLLQSMTGPARAASFDCSKAASHVEQEICTDGLIGRLDEAMAANYKAMLFSNIGTGAIRHLKATQRAWLSIRNKCTTRQCILDAYRKRVDEVCDYPVISGVHPGCASADELE